MPGLADYNYERMGKKHLHEVVALHEDCFGGYYLTNLGPAFLRAMYWWYVHSPEAIAHVALDSEGRPAGFVAGTANEAGYRSSLFRSTWWRMALALARRFVSQPRLTLRLLGERKDLIGQALASIITRRSRDTGVTDSVSDRQPPTGSLVSIGVRPAARRSGLGTALTDFFVKEAWDRGCDRVTLSVRDDNEPARRFYESMDWEEVSRSAETYHGSFSITYQKVRNRCERAPRPE